MHRKEGDTASWISSGTSTLHPGKMNRLVKMTRQTKRYW